MLRSLKVGKEPNVQNGKEHGAQPCSNYIHRTPHLCQCSTRCSNYNHRTPHLCQCSTRCSNNNHRTPVSINTAQGWASVLFKRTQRSRVHLRSFQKNKTFSRSFALFIKRTLRSLVLCVLLHSL